MDGVLGDPLTALFAPKSFFYCTQWSKMGTNHTVITLTHAPVVIFNSGETTEFMVNDRVAMVMALCNM